ncbi:MAG: DUF1176 domain-containing protein [Pseudomonadota bacterium]
MTDGRVHPALFACVFALACATLPAAAEEAEPVSFQHQDWELVCDNTRTCRAAGYQQEYEEASLPVSVLFTRKAGPATPVAGQVALGDDWEESVLDDLPERFKLAMTIDGRAQGEIAMQRKDAVADLTSAQTAALLKALARDTRIEFRVGDRTWMLSDSGASAVLLKMDEVQGRVGTPGALRRPGKRNESEVLPPLSAPVVRAVEPHPPKPADSGFLDRHGEALREALRGAASEEDCMDLFEANDPQPLQVARLTKTKLLVSTRCWLAAYNSGDGYWIINDRPPFDPEFVTESANAYEDGALSATHKGRGIGDCWSTEEWTWDGTRFVPTREMTTGQCRGFPGGAWTLPTRVSDVRP